jgi:hypothetical protein
LECLSREAKSRCACSGILSHCRGSGDDVSQRLLCSPGREDVGAIFLNLTALDLVEALSAELIEKHKTNTDARHGLGILVLDTRDTEEVGTVHMPYAHNT